MLVLDALIELLFLSLQVEKLVEGISLPWILGFPLKLHPVNLTLLYLVQLGHFFHLTFLLLSIPLLLFQIDNFFESWLISQYHLKEFVFVQIFIDLVVHISDVFKLFTIMVVLENLLDALLESCHHDKSTHGNHAVVHGLKLLQCFGEEVFLNDFSELLARFSKQPVSFGDPFEVVALLIGLHRFNLFKTIG